MSRPFWTITIAVFALIVILTYLPILSGKIPFPKNLVLRHIAWKGTPYGEGIERSPEIGDLVTSFYPFHTLVSRAAAEKSLALWNPHLLSGTPLAANSQSALFYPPNLLYYILPVEAAWTICILARMFLAALFMALFMHTIGAATMAATLSGIIFSSCGFMTAWQGQAMDDAAIWLPLICYSVHRLHKDRSSRSVAIAAFAFAMPVLAGHPEMAFYLTVTGCALALLLSIPFDKRFLLLFTLAGVLAMGVASVQMIPTLEWLRQVGGGLDAPWPALSRHDGQGFFSRDILRSPNSAGLAIPEAAAYIGMLSLMAASLAWFHTSRRYVVFFITITMIAAAVAFSVNPVHWIVDHLPLVKALKNGRLILISSFGIAALAGLGLTVAAVYDRRRSQTAATVGMFIVAAVGIFETYRATLSPVEITRGPAAALVFLIAAAIVFAIRGPLFPGLACGLVALEFISFSYGYTGFARPDEIFPSAPVFDFLRARGNPSTFRIAKAGFPIPANSALMYDLQTADGYDVVIERTRTFTKGLREDRDDGVFFSADKLVLASDRRFDMLNVKYIAVIAPSPEYDQFATRADRFKEIYKDGSVAVFENKTAMPRILAVPQAGGEIVNDEKAQLGRIQSPEFDPEKTVILPTTAEALDRTALSNTFTANIELQRNTVNDGVFSVQTNAPSILVLSQIFYPGWRATIDGNQTPVYPANYALMAILAPAGRHDIRFYFQPTSFRIGASVTGLTLLILAGLYFRDRGFARGR